jgi:ketosteroid isomerase-like protein
MNNPRKSGVILLVAGLALNCLFGCTGNDKKEMSEMDKQQIANTLIDMEKAALERWGNGDPDGFLEIIAEDYTYFDPFIDTRVDNYEIIKEDYDAIRGQIYYERFELIDPKVQVEKDIAVLTFNFKSFGKTEDGNIVERSHWHTTEVFRKFDKDWKLISTHWSFVNDQLIKLDSMDAFSGEPTVVKKVELPPLQGEVEETVLGMEQAALDRWGNGDVSGYIEITADDYTYFDPSLNKRLDGLSAFKEYLEPIRGKVHIDRAEFINPRVQTDGKTAVLTFNLMNYKIGDDGEETPGSHWHSTEIYRNIDGNWKLISSHWSYTFSMLKKLSESGAFGTEGE